MGNKRLAVYPRYLVNSVRNMISKIRERAKTIVIIAIDSAATRPIAKLKFLFMIILLYSLIFLTLHQDNCAFKACISNHLVFINSI